MERVPDLTERYVMQDKAKSFARWGHALMIAGGEQMIARQVYAERWPNSRHLGLVERASVAAGTTSGWGAGLSPLQPLAAAFVEFIRPRTVLGRLVGTRRVPFDIAFATQTAGFGAGWAGEGKPIIVSKGEFDRHTFDRAKIAGIVVLTKELVRSSDPAAEAVVERDLAAGVVEFSDTQLLDPTIAEVPEVSPASITNGATEITSTGATAAQVEADLSAMVASLVTGGIAFEAPYWVMTPKTALALAQLRGAGGERIFPDVGPLGGTIWTIPVIVSASAGAQITLLDAAEIMVADDGIEFVASEEGTLRMSSTPEDADAPLVSLWQNNLIGLKTTRYVRWKRRRDAAVVWMAVSY
ncbi:MAG TPA: phage major capsid protein [Brevundimonas sp.]|uniref:phage major capsid protein n=1 Tax=Brevundimonas naejangsanensis TaxID=588932 RepID=UPI000EF059CE|nr:phage major capsid protein [Brevundimonas naejangsanensis]HAC01568.1 phage major capsid protein [Brevundimonas sp.]